MTGIDKCVKIKSDNNCTGCYFTIEGVGCSFSAETLTDYLKLGCYKDNQNYIFKFSLNKVFKKL